jgi:monofunctional biosynthetic peptidoglycan transglycosylase
MKKFFIGFLIFFFASLIGFWIWFPTEAEIKGCIITSMFQVDLCPKSKNYVPLSQISKNMQNAVIITEDSSFYQHKGFDEEGIQKCFEKMKEKYRIVCGGSTITQQLAKNMFLSRDKNFLRKGVEALITIKIEKTLTKKEILEKYLNVVQFGKNIFGIKQAAQFYFKKHPSQLEPNEAAFLAMVLPNPEKYSQSFFRKDLTRFARKRVDRIVRNMHRFGRIDAGAYNNAVGNIDYFIKGEKAPPKENQEELTDEDLDEMINEINEENPVNETSTTSPPEEELSKNKKQEQIETN